MTTTPRPRSRLLLGALGLAAVGTGVLGYVDWHDHRPAEPTGRAAQLCDLPTGTGTPLGRLLPDGAQDTEERAFRWVRADDRPKGCSIRVDGRLALTVTATPKEGTIDALPDGGAPASALHTFGTGSRSASWPTGAAAAEYCPGTDPRFRHVVLEVAPGEAARTGQPDADRADYESVARDLFDRYLKAVCA
ncbi:hypothetical protein [Kitasatospora sp. NPDC090091]|uniref:hypothetical protein n=1 Tax=Kitasatospora sp. NPDC090091 TaxID=3364081 RepID=UPI0038082176